jgi:alkanesulfonate monooxygenase SsuD/methylene tetrahydromethanopterin reductase-like flavin-dependent oxidoreductase (luciferase family)
MSGILHEEVPMTAIKIGYLLPTREQIMEGRPEAAPLIALAERAEALGYASVWVGDSLLARPRHEPLTLLAGVAGRARRVELGTAVLLPALRNPVLLAHSVATLDQVSEGRVILGVGIGLNVPSVHAEFAAAGVPFEKRVGRMLEGLRLCRALWTGKPIDWNGRWTVQSGALAPTPARAGGPPIWIGGNLQSSRAQAGKFFEGWLPITPSPKDWAIQWGEVQSVARAAHRDTAKITGGMYLTLSIDDDEGRANERMNTFLEQYYNQPAASLRSWQANYAGTVDGAKALLRNYADAGVGHIVLRFIGDHERHLEALAGAP